MLEEGLVPFFDVLSDDVAVGEHFQPELRNGFLGEVVVLGFLFLFSE